MSQPLRSAWIRKPLIAGSLAATFRERAGEQPRSLIALQTREPVSALPWARSAFATPRQELSFLPPPVRSQKWV